MTSSDPTPRPMSCPEMVELLTTYLDGALDDADRAAFDAHLGLCPGCVRYLDQYRETIAATGTLAESDVDPGVLAALLRAFRDWRASRSGGAV